MKKIIVIWPRLKKVIKEAEFAEMMVFTAFTGIIFTALCVVFYQFFRNLINLF